MLGCCYEVVCIYDAELVPYSFINVYSLCRPVVWLVVVGIFGLHQVSAGMYCDHFLNLMNFVL